MRYFNKNKIKRTLFATALLLATSMDAALAATSAGLDTPNGITSMPIAIGGTEVMSVTPAGLLIPNAAGALNATALTTLVNLLNTPACTSGQYLTKATATTFQCVTPPVSASTTTAAAASPVATAAAAPAPSTADTSAPVASAAPPVVDPLAQLDLENAQQNEAYAALNAAEGNTAAAAQFTAAAQQERNDAAIVAACYDGSPCGGGSSN